MSPDLLRNYPYLFPIFFVGLWLIVSVLLGFLSGWYWLMIRYPDRNEDAVVTLRNQSGMLGLVSMRRILSLGACSSGLRVGMARLFGPFCRNIFVPWSDIRVTRRERLFWRSAVLEFRDVQYPRLSISAEAADRLARESQGKWPETGDFRAETDAAALERIAKQWLLSTCFAAAFFIFVPRVLAPNAPRPPIAVAILFPAIVFGLGACIQYLRRKR